ncbi:1-acyl-sn-glycerol-3-phosphate acyltransferase [bacterium]|nr:1-acyl-sn-glycerol-3-phosphate acyltransferase [bacterium]
MPLLLRLIMKLRIAPFLPDETKRLLEVSSGGALITCNHPTDGDPPSLWSLLYKVRIDARFMAGWDILQRMNRWSRKILQHSGVFSVRRARMDRQAIARALHHLSQERSVVLFPEGHTHGLATRLLPYQEGAAFIGIAAARKRETPLPILPLAVHYRYKEGDSSSVQHQLSALEESLEQTGKGTGYERLLGCVDALLTLAETEEGISGTGTLEGRLANLYSGALANLEKELGLPHAPEKPVPHRIQHLREALDENPSPRGRLHQRVMRLHAFASAKVGHIKENPTQSRILETITLLRKEVSATLGSSPPTPLVRIAVFRVGEPLFVDPSVLPSPAELTRLLENRTEELISSLEREWGIPMESFV